MNNDLTNPHSIDVPDRLSGDGVERRLLKQGADGRVTPDVGRRWGP